MLWGFFQKLVIAERAGEIVNAAFADPKSFSGLPMLVAVLMYSLQIYGDFAGYSNIAVGAAKIFGFDLIQNFHQPYFSTSIKEFWRRWHISLFSWLRDYIYIPLGGSRCAQWKKYRNILITFLVSGLWHGAGWSFIAWGLLHGIYQIFGEVLRPARNQVYRLLHLRQDSYLVRFWKTACTFLLVTFAWVFFRAGSIQNAMEVLGSLFTWNLPGVSLHALFEIRLSDMLVLFASLGILLFVDCFAYKGNWYKKCLQTNRVTQSVAVMLLLFIVLLFGIYGPGYLGSDFIYARF